jgi:uncharacterized membrane protein YphA (DoxX/SURF4 family)
MELRNAMKSVLYGNRLVASVRILLGGLFLYSGFFKVMDPVAFGGTIAMYQLVPEILVPYFALTISSLELVLGALLVTGTGIRPAAFISILMMLVFSVAISINLAQGRKFDCGCFELSRFGISENLSSWLVLRDLVIAFLLYPVFNAKRHFYSIESLVEKMKLRDA